MFNVINAIRFIACSALNASAGGGGRQALRAGIRHSQKPSIRIREHTCIANARARAVIREQKSQITPARNTKHPTPQQQQKTPACISFSQHRIFRAVLFVCACVCKQNYYSSIPHFVWRGLKFYKPPPLPTTGPGPFAALV